jgi:hypothetical protein
VRFSIHAQTAAFDSLFEAMQIQTALVWGLAVTGVVF